MNDFLKLRTAVKAVSRLEDGTLGLRVRGNDGMYKIVGLSVPAGEPGTCWLHTSLSYLSRPALPPSFVLFFLIALQVCNKNILYILEYKLA